MTEEKENKGSYSLQIKIPNELKDKLEKKSRKSWGIFKSVYNVSFYRWYKREMQLFLFFSKMRK